jgi:methylenetetrahydrofolate dehydrogenase (NADP+)/methenyltetrahydrofolate cyclohydrolase
MARVLDGNAIAGQVKAQVAAGVAEFRQAHGRAPGLQVILAGDDAASAVYVRNKEKAAHEAGFAGGVHRMPASASQFEVLQQVERFNADPAVDGILVQLPLPPQVKPQPVLEAIDPAKDVDGFHAVNVGALWSTGAGLVPCTPRGAMHLLRAAEVPIAGAHAVIVGRSNIVEVCRSADILIAALGKPRFITAEYVRPGAAVIDVGINRDQNGKLCGDVDFAAVEPIAGVITPVPGGVGPMTIAMLLENTLQAARARKVAASH